MKQIWTITYYEMVQIFKDKILFLLLFIVPLAYAIIFGFVYFAGVVTNIPLGIVDLNQTRLSQEIVTAFDNSPRFHTVKSIATYDQLEKGMKEGTVRAGIVIPEDFAQKVTQKQNTQVLSIYDASNLLWGYNARKYLLEVVADFNVHRAAESLAGLGYTQKEITNTISSISYNTTIWYNPTFSYTNYFFMGLLMMVIHQIALLSISLTVTREKEKNTWLQFISSSVPKWKIFLGKSLPYFIVNFFSYALLIWLASYFIHVKIMGSIPLIVLMGLLYITIITGIGFFISVHAPNSLQVTRFSMLVSVPIFICSGYTWPQSHIPPAINYLSNVLPFAWMSNGLRLVTIKELDWAHITPTITALSVMAIVSLCLALSFSKKRKTPRNDEMVVHYGTSFPQK